MPSAKTATGLPSGQHSFDENFLSDVAGMYNWVVFTVSRGISRILDTLLVPTDQHRPAVAPRRLLRRVLHGDVDLRLGQWPAVQS